MGLDIRLDHKLELGLKLAPQIIQSIELLQFNSLDLAERIDAEIDTNEFLEKVDRDLTPAAEERTTTPESTEAAEPGSDQAVEIEQQADKDAELERYEQMDIWDDPSLRRPRATDEKAINAKLEAMNNTAGAGPTLEEHLLAQLSLAELSESDEELAAHLIGNLDERGYLLGSWPELLEAYADRFEEADGERVLAIIQRLDPKGVGARDIAECLRLQLDPSDPRFELKIRLVTEHLEDLQKNRLPRIARALDLDLDDLKSLMLELADLDPSPGLAAAEEPNHYIHPDVIVEWDGHEDYEVRLVNEYVPELRLSEEYRLALGNRDLSTEYRDYVKKKVDSARAFIQAIEKRQKTLKDVAERIVHYQRDFLDFGPHYLKPLKMQQVADDVGVHVSTISRATSEKYIQTHRGIFSMKYFFTGGTQSVDGEEESRESIKNKIKELVDREDKKKPWSDDELVRRLKEVHGIQVARRTVTKYRKALSIPSSRQRREY